MWQQPQLLCKPTTQQEMLLEGYTQYKLQGLKTGPTGSSPCRSRILYPQLAPLAAPWIPNCSGLFLFQGVSCALQESALDLTLVLRLFKTVLQPDSVCPYAFVWQIMAARVLCANSRSPVVAIGLWPFLPLWQASKCMCTSNSVTISRSNSNATSSSSSS